MSRLYANSGSAIEIATHFDIPQANAAVPPGTVEDRVGLVVLDTNAGQVVSSMRWDFPRTTIGMDLRGDPPQRLGLVADLTNPMWSVWSSILATAR